MLDAAVRASGAASHHPTAIQHAEAHADDGERAPRLAAHVQWAYAGRRRLPRMLHGAARELVRHAHPPLPPTPNPHPTPTPAPASAPAPAPAPALAPARSDPSP